MTTDLFDGPPDPRDVRATLRDLSHRHDREEWIARVWVEDGTEAEGIEVVCRASDSLRCTVGLDAGSIEREVARYINLSWRPEHRLVAVRARVELGGEYRFGGDTEAGLHITEPPIRVARSTAVSVIT